MHVACLRDGTCYTVMLLLVAALENEPGSFYVL